MNSITLFIGCERLTLNVGDEVGTTSGRYHSSKICKIAKITPSGQILLDDGRRFNKNGRELATADYMAAHLIPAANVRRIEEERKTASAIHGTAAKIEELVNTIRRYPHSEGNAARKVELLRLVSSL